MPVECFPPSRGSSGREKNDKLLPSSVSRPGTFLRGSSSKELLLDNQAQEEQRREMLETVKQLTGGLESDRSSAEPDRSKAKEVGEFLPEWADPGAPLEARLGRSCCPWLSLLSAAGLVIHPHAAADLLRVPHLSPAETETAFLCKGFCLFLDRMPSGLSYF